jgi:hypothetical protein
LERSIMTNVVELIPADEDWKPKTAMDRVLVRVHEVSRFAADVCAEEDLEQVCTAMEEIARDFRAARAKGSRLTP